MTDTKENENSQSQEQGMTAIEKGIIAIIPISLIIGMIYFFVGRAEANEAGTSDIALAFQSIGMGFLTTFFVIFLLFKFIF